MIPLYESLPQCQMRPQGFGNNQQTQSPCNGSCVHGQFPAYNMYWPPCYPLPQVPYHPCCMNNHSGFYPHASSSYAPPCYVHSPCCPASYHQPWYVCSEKDVPGEHRCGKFSSQMCCYPKDDSRARGGVVIEEHDPEVLVRSTNGSYPTIQIPRENVRAQEHGSSSLGLGNREVKAPESMTVQKFFPNPWNGCFPFDESTVKSLVQNQERKKVENGENVEIPFDFSKLKSLLQGQDLKEGKIQRNKEEQEQLPYPIFWVPSHAKREDVEASESSNEGRNLESVSSDLHGNEGQNPQNVLFDIRRNEGNCERNVPSDVEKKISLRSIPVERRVQEARNIPVKLSEDHLPKPTELSKTIAKKKTEPIGNTKKEQSSSPPKASRLPPVCLRVDPLPKRRNGGSKSLNSPRRKEKPLPSEETRVVTPQSTKTVPEACSAKCEEANEEKQTFEECVNAAGTEKESVESKSNLQEVANCEIVKPCETKENKEKPAKKTFTEEEAARMIQSRFRGYDVRRWEPVKKLKEIACVRKEMEDVKNRIQALGVSTDNHIEEKEIVILGEMVMNLLLKLDSVQGLHPSIRDHRKSLARELSDIEDKLDSMKDNCAVAEKEIVNEHVEITSQTSDCQVNLEHSQLEEENIIVPETNAEEVPSPEEHPLSVLNRTDDSPVAEVEEGSGLFEILATDPESSIREAASTSVTVPEKTEEVESMQPLNPLSADGGEEMTVTNIEEGKAEVKSLDEPENPRVVEMENVTEETEASALENEDIKGEDDTILPSKECVEVSELLPVGVTDDETHNHLQDSSSCIREAAMEPESVIQEETNIDHYSDHSKDLAQDTSSEPQEESKQPSETEVTDHEIPAETKRLMEENQRFKETMETLVMAGREQLEVISKLTGRVKSLEKKLSQKKKRTRIGGVRKPNRVKDATKPMTPNLNAAVL